MHAARCWRRVSCRRPGIPRQCTGSSTLHTPQQARHAQGIPFPNHDVHYGHGKKAGTADSCTHPAAQKLISAPLSRSRPQIAGEHAQPTRHSTDAISRVYYGRSSASIVVQGRSGTTAPRFTLRPFIAFGARRSHVILAIEPGFRSRAFGGRHKTINTGAAHSRLKHFCLLLRIDLMRLWTE